MGLKGRFTKQRCTPKHSFQHSKHIIQKNECQSSLHCGQSCCLCQWFGHSAPNHYLSNKRISIQNKYKNKSSVWTIAQRRARLAWNSWSRAFWCQNSYLDLVWAFSSNSDIAWKKEICILLDSCVKIFEQLISWLNISW